MKNNSRYFFIIILLLFVSSGCAPLHKITYKEIVSGSYEDSKAQLSENIVKGIKTGEAIAFYNVDGDPLTYKQAARPATISIVQKAEDLTFIKKFSDLKIYKYATNGNLIIGNMELDENRKLKNDELSYTFLMVNKGTTDLEEVILADVLPKRFIPLELEYMNTPIGFSDDCNYKTENFDDFVWEIKEDHGVRYLIVKIVMNKKPLQAPGRSEAKASKFAQRPMTDLSSINTCALELVLHGKVEQ